MTNKERFLYVIGALAVIAVVIVIIAYVGRGVSEQKPTIDISQYLQLEDSEFANEAQRMQYENAYAVLVEDPANLDALKDLGALYHAMERYDDAEAIFMEALNYAPQDLVVHQNLGSLYQAQGMYPEAEAQYYKLLEITPVWMPAYDALGQMYRFELVPRTQRFIDQINAARQVDYNDQYEEQLLRYAGFYYYYADQKAEALEYFRPYLELKPEDNAVQEIVDEITALPGNIQFKE